MHHQSRILCALAVHGDLDQASVGRLAQLDDAEREQFLGYLGRVGGR